MRNAHLAVRSFSPTIRGWICSGLDLKPHTLKVYSLSTVILNFQLNSHSFPKTCLMKTATGILIQKRRNTNMNERMAFNLFHHVYTFRGERMFLTSFLVEKLSKSEQVIKAAVCQSSNSTVLKISLDT